MRTCAKLDGLVACAELDVEPGNKGMHKVVAACGKSERLDESKIWDGDGVEVEGDERVRVSNDGLHLDSVYKRFGKGGVLEW